ALGEVGTALLFFLAGSAGVFLIARTEPRALYRDLKWLSPDFDSWIASAEPETTSPPVAEAAPPPKPKSAAKPAPPPGPPVINFPVAEPVAKSAAPVPATAVVAGEKLPLPDITHLRYYAGVTPEASDLEAKARVIEQTLASFKVDAFVR